VRVELQSFWVNPLTLNHLLELFIFVSEVRKCWSDKNVNLELLTRCIGDFFKENEFNAIKEESESGYQILAEDSPRFEMEGCVSVAVEGHPNDFFVDLDLCVEKGRRLLLGPLTMSLFGGGIYYLRRIKTKENWIRLEKEFWKYVDNALLRVADSAGC